MKEQDVIKKLKLLRSVEPSFRTLKEIRREVSGRITPKKQVIVIPWNKPIFGFGALLAVLIIFGLFFTSAGQRALLSTRIALAPNHYVKAQIALSYARNELARANTHTQLQAADIQDIAYATKLANTEMSGLKLMGEKGKYTSQQCQYLYQGYYQYLDLTDDIMKDQSHDNDHDFSQLSSELTAYEQQAQQKIHKYKPL